MFRREKKYLVKVSDAEFRVVIDSLIALRNHLIEERRYTDCVDEMLMKLLA